MDVLDKKRLSISLSGVSSIHIGLWKMELYGKLGEGKGCPSASTPTYLGNKIASRISISSQILPQYKVHQLRFQLST